MSVQRASGGTKLAALSPAAHMALQHNADTVDTSRKISGFSEDGAIGWLSCGAALEVFFTTTGRRVAAWRFGAILKEPNTLVTAICECFCGERNTKLLVATLVGTSSTPMLCLFDMKKSRVTKAIELTDQVSSLCMVRGVGSQQTMSAILSEHLRSYCGIAAVGTCGGRSFLVDLCMDEEEEVSDELHPAAVAYLDPRSPNVTAVRYKTVSKGRHLCMELGDENHHRGYFYYRRPDGSSIKTFSEDDTTVSCLHFIAQAGLLVIGFSFGAFQLWQLNVPVLVYTQRLPETDGAITHLSYQEPENDPRNYCYLWVVRGPSTVDSVQRTENSTLCLSQLGFVRKQWYNGFGYLFEELTSVGPRFEHELSANPFGSAEPVPAASHVLSCRTITNPHFTPPHRHDDHDSFDDGGSSPDLSVCMFAWTTEAQTTDARPTCNVALFDLNRWYHAQMPDALRCLPGYELCPFFSVCSMEGAQQASQPNPLLAVCIPYRSLSKFKSPLIPSPEQHFFPSSLAFDVLCLSEGGITQSRCLGVQRHLLSELEKQGAGMLVAPHDVYNLSMQAGLVARTSETSPTTTFRREAVLTLALEHHLVGFLARCVTQLGGAGVGATGCSPRTLLDWAWKRVAAIKSMVDGACECLYDWSGRVLDTQTQQLLQQHHTSLQHLATLLQSMKDTSLPTTTQGREELEMRLMVTSLLHQHLGVTLWCYTAGLLPEQPEEEESTEMLLVYPSTMLTDTYQRRRAELKKLHSDLRPTDLLMIDGFVSNMGAPLTGVWEREGGSGLYPPPSIHTLLKTYLMEGISEQLKHALILYVLCDLFNTAPDDLQPKLQELVVQFGQVFSVSPTAGRLVQAMWCLDHKDFSQALQTLLDPCLQQDLVPWQHTRIVKALLYQGEAQLALQYLRVRRPPTATPDDVKLRLTVLLANGLTAEAFQYQQLCRDETSSHDLMSHLFLACQQTQTIDQLLHMPFSDEEERHLVNHLETSGSAASQELLVLYFLQRARYIEAARVNDKLRHNMGDMSLEARDRARMRNAIVDGYRRVLPSVQRRLCDSPGGVHRRLRGRREVRPAPLSTVVTRGKNGAVVTRAALLRTVTDKVQEIKQMNDDVYMELPNMGSPHPDADSTRQMALSPGPFVGTPVTPRPRTRLRTLPEVVYPTSDASIVGGGNILSTSMARLVASPARSPRKQSLLGGTSPHGAGSSWLGGSSTARKSSVMSESLKLLDTPPVVRKPPSRSFSSTASKNLPSQPSTPQSILKSKTLSRFIQSTQDTDYSLFDMPTPPPPTRIPMPVAILPSAPATHDDITPPSTPPHLDSVAMATPHSATPKLLRFINVPDESMDGEEQMEDSPENREEEAFISAQIRRNIRERSVTPERKSPKMASKTDSLSPKVSSIETSQNNLSQSQLFVQRISQSESFSTKWTTLDEYKDPQPERLQLVGKSAEQIIHPLEMSNDDDPVVIIDEEVTMVIGDKSKLHFDADVTQDTVPLVSPPATLSPPDITPDTAPTQPSSTIGPKDILDHSDTVSAVEPSPTLAKEPVFCLIKDLNVKPTDSISQDISDDEPAEIKDEIKTDVVLCSDVVDNVHSSDQQLSSVSGDDCSPVSDVKNSEQSEVETESVSVTQIETVVMTQIETVVTSALTDLNNTNLSVRDFVMEEDDDDENHEESSIKAASAALDRVKHSVESDTQSESESKTLSGVSMVTGVAREVASMVTGVDREMCVSVPTPGTPTRRRSVARVAGELTPRRSTRRKMSESVVGDSIKTSSADVPADINGSGDVPDATKEQSCRRSSRKRRAPQYLGEVSVSPPQSSHLTPSPPQLASAVAQLEMIRVQNQQELIRRRRSSSRSSHGDTICTSRILEASEIVDSSSEDEADGRINDIYINTETKTSRTIAIVDSLKSHPVERPLEGADSLLTKDSSVESGIANTQRPTPNFKYSETEISKDHIDGHLECEDHIKLKGLAKSQEQQDNNESPTRNFDEDAPISPRRSPRLAAKMKLQAARVRAEREANKQKHVDETSPVRRANSSIIVQRNKSPEQKIPPKSTSAATVNQPHTVLPLTPSESSTSPGSTLSSRDVSPSNKLPTWQESDFDCSMALKKIVEETSVLDSPTRRVTRANSRQSSPVPQEKVNPGSRGRGRPRGSRRSTLSSSVSVSEEVPDTANKKEEGPLSQASFMMRLRRASTSREVTPDRVSTQDHTQDSTSTTTPAPLPHAAIVTEAPPTLDNNGAAEEFSAATPFTFSEPLSFKPASEAEPTGLPSQSFIFSPPLTRSRRQSFLQTTTAISPMVTPKATATPKALNLNHTPSTPQTPATPQVSTEGGSGAGEGNDVVLNSSFNDIQTRKAAVTRRVYKKPSIISTDSPINFVSPHTEVVSPPPSGAITRKRSLRQPAGAAAPRVTRSRLKYRKNENLPW